MCRLMFAIQFLLIYLFNFLTAYSYNCGYNLSDQWMQALNCTLRSPKFMCSVLQ